jgi:hypothetical protein
MNSSREAVARDAVGREPAYEVSPLAALLPDQLHLSAQLFGDVAAVGVVL